MKLGSALILSLLVHAISVEAGTPDSATVRAGKIEGMFSTYQRDFKDAPFITAHELVSRRRETNVLIVDVRTEKERQVSAIPHSISKEEFERDENKYKTNKIIVYCTIGYRSGLYTERLQKKGFDAYNLKGGVLAWADAGQLFVGQEGPTKRVHVYGAKWNLLPSDYEAVW